MEFDEDEPNSVGMWMVQIRLNNGRVVGVRPSYCELIEQGNLK
jgi:hypothetical protein